VSSLAAWTEIPPRGRFPPQRQGDRSSPSTERQETFYSFTASCNPATFYRYDVASGGMPRTSDQRPRRRSISIPRLPDRAGFYASKDTGRSPHVSSVRRRALIVGGGRIRPSLLWATAGPSISRCDAADVSRRTSSGWTPHPPPHNPPPPPPQRAGLMPLPNLRGGGEYVK